MALVGANLAVGGFHARSRRGVDQRTDLARPVEDVPFDPDASEPGSGRRQRAKRPDHATAFAADVVRIHRPHQRLVRAGVEAQAQLLALVFEVGADAVAGVEVDLRAVGRHGQLARQLEAALAVERQELQLNVIPAGGEVADDRRRRDRHDRLDSRGSVERHLERNHATQRAADSERQRLDAQGVERRPLGSRHIPRRDQWEG